jgi:hypothetical protein
MTSPQNASETVGFVGIAAAFVEVPLDYLSWPRRGLTPLIRIKPLALIS